MYKLTEQLKSKDVTSAVIGMIRYQPLQCLDFIEFTKFCYINTFVISTKTVGSCCDWGNSIPTFILPYINKALTLGISYVIKQEKD